MQSLEEKLTTKWYREYSHKLHMQRLQEIKSHASKRIDNSTPKTKEKLLTQKQGKEFLQKEKKKSITKHNQQLLKILTEINKGKRETVTQKILNSARDPPAVKSLNISVRKKEARRIDEDNEALVRRLNEKPAELSAKKFQDEWEIASRYRESISKKGNRYGTSHLASRLPPMESHERMALEKEEDGLSKTLGSINLPSIQKKIKKKPINHDNLAQVIEKNRRRSEDVVKDKIKNDFVFDFKASERNSQRLSPKESSQGNKADLQTPLKEQKKVKTSDEEEKNDDEKTRNSEKHQEDDKIDHAKGIIDANKESKDPSKNNNGHKKDQNEEVKEKNHELREKNDELKEKNDEHKVKKDEFKEKNDETKEKNEYKAKNDEPKEKNDEHKEKDDEHKEKKEAQIDKNDKNELSKNQVNHEISLESQKLDEKTEKNPKDLKVLPEEQKIQEKPEEKLHDETKNEFEKSEINSHKNSHDGSLKDLSDHLEKIHNLNEKEGKNSQNLIEEKKELIENSSDIHKVEKNPSKETLDNPEPAHSVKTQERDLKNDSFKEEKPVKSSEVPEMEPLPLSDERKEEAKKNLNRDDKVIIEPLASVNPKIDETAERFLKNHLNSKVSDHQVDSKHSDHNKDQNLITNDPKDPVNEEIPEESFEKIEVKPSEVASQALFEKLEEQKEVVIEVPEVET